MGCGDPAYDQALEVENGISKHQEGVHTRGGGLMRGGVSLKGRQI